MLADQEALFFRMLTGGASETELGKTFAASNTVPLAERARVYQDAYVWRQILALREDFSVCHALAGDAFDALAKNFVLQKPSRHPSLAKRGEGFAEFLRAQNQRELSAMAKLEWARAWIFDAKEMPVCDAVVMQTPGVENAHVRLVAAQAVLETEFIVTPAWRAVSNNTVNNGEDAAPPPEAREWIHVWRKDFTVFHASISENEARALLAAQNGATIAEICALFEDAKDAFSALARWFEEGVVHAV